MFLPQLGVLLPQLANGGGEAEGVGWPGGMGWNGSGAQHFTPLW